MPVRSSPLNGRATAARGKRACVEYGQKESAKPTRAEQKREKRGIVTVRSDLKNDLIWQHVETCSRHRVVDGYGESTKRWAETFIPRCMSHTSPPFKLPNLVRYLLIYGIFTTPFRFYGSLF